MTTSTRKARKAAPAATPSTAPVDTGTLATIAREVADRKNGTGDYAGKVSAPADVTPQAERAVRTSATPKAEAPAKANAAQAKAAKAKAAAEHAALVAALYTSFDALDSAEADKIVRTVGATTSGESADVRATAMRDAAKAADAKAAKAAAIRARSLGVTVGMVAPIGTGPDSGAILSALGTRKAPVAEAVAAYVAARDDYAARMTSGLSALAAAAEAWAARYAAVHALWLALDRPAVATLARDLGAKVSTVRTDVIAGRMVALGLDAPKHGEAVAVRPEWLSQAEAEAEAAKAKAHEKLAQETASLRANVDVAAREAKAKAEAKGVSAAEADKAAKVAEARAKAAVAESERQATDAESKAKREAAAVREHTRKAIADGRKVAAATAKAKALQADTSAVSLAMVSKIVEAVEALSHRAAAHGWDKADGPEIGDTLSTLAGTVTALATIAAEAAVVPAVPVTSKRARKA